MEPDSSENIDIPLSQSTVEKGKTYTHKRKKGPFKRLLTSLNKTLTKYLDNGKISELSQVDSIQISSKNEEDDELEREIINAAYEFKELKVRSAMTPRVKIVAIDKNSSLDDLIYLALEEGFSRIPVYDKNIDNVIGVVFVKDLLCLIGTDKALTKTTSDFIREINRVPETAGLSSVWNLLTGQKSGVAVVSDEYGGTAGIITLEDIVESIMGDVRDEYDEEQTDIKLISTKDGNSIYEISGDSDPQDVFELFSVEKEEFLSILNENFGSLKDDEYITMSGFAAGITGQIPEEGEIFTFGEIKFTAIETAENKIVKLLAEGKTPV